MGTILKEFGWPFNAVVAAMNEEVLKYTTGAGRGSNPEKPKRVVP